MPAIVVDLVVLAGLIYLAVLGSTAGFYATVVAGLEIYAALVLAVLLHEPIAGFLTPHLVENLGFFLPEWFSLPAWTLFLCFAGLMWGTFLFLWLVVHPKVAPRDAKPSGSRIDQAGGAIAGWFAGMLLLGAALVTWSMLPVGFLRVPAAHMFVDVGRTALRAAGVFAGERHEGRSVVVYGEPVSREGVDEARLTSEAWCDWNGDGKPDDTDYFFDSDGNGSFTKDLYYLDLDTDRQRRVGLLEKYTVGRWDHRLTVSNRERTPKGQVAARTPRKPPAAAVPPAASAAAPPAPPPDPDAPPPAAAPAAVKLPPLPTAPAATAAAAAKPAAEPPAPAKPAKPAVPPVDDF